MRRSKRLIISMVISIFISSIIIFLCESKNFENIRILIKEYIIFFDGKKSVIENIFIGIFGSSLIALIGFIFEYNVEKRRMHLKIINLFKIIYFRYYKLVGTNNIEGIKEIFLQDEAVNEISSCIMEYERFFCVKDDIYESAIGVMKWTQLYYTKIFCIHSVLIEIEGYIKDIKVEIQKMKDVEYSMYMDIEHSKETLSTLEEQYKDILSEFNSTINDELKVKKEMDINKVDIIKREFGILDDVMAAFYGNVCYVKRVWKDIEK